MTFPAYQNYKNSGDAFLGQIPIHWTVKRVRSIADVKNGFPFDSALFDEAVGHQLIRIRDLNCSDTATKFNGPFIDAASVTEADVLIGMDGDFNVGKWRGKTPALLNQRMCCVRTEDKVLSNFLFHYLPLPLRAINDVTYSTTVKHLSSFQVEKMCLALPENADELSKIVYFLDSETAKIDALIQEQQALIDLLNEDRTVSVAKLLFGGKHGKIAESEVEWIGAVPTHWSVIRICNLFTESTELGGDGLPVLSVSIHHGVSDKELDDDELDRKVNRSDDRGKYKRVQPGDLVYNMMRAWQGGFGSVEVDGLVSPAYVVARPSCNISSKYVESVLRTSNAIVEIKSRSRGVTDFRLRLYWDEFRDIRIPVPPADEQVAILSEISAIDLRVDELKQEASKLIELLLERRLSLITAVVTGKIDVRGFVAPPVQ